MYIYIYIYISKKYSNLIFSKVAYLVFCLYSSCFKYWYVVFFQVHPMTFFSFLYLKLGIYIKPYIDTYVYGMLVVK